MIPRLLLTGGSGLLALNWALTVRARRTVTLGVHERMVEMAGVASRRISLETVDNVTRALDEIEPGCVVHTAGLTDVDRCERDPELARDVNVRLASNVAVACAKAGVALVHISTDHLFAGEDRMADESRPVAPVNVYARTKADGEKAVLDANPAALVVRTNFYCWGPEYRRSFSDYIIDSLRAGRRVTLFLDVFYTPIVAVRLVEAAHDLVSRGASGVFHVTGDERVSKYDFGVMLCNRFDLDSDLIAPGRIADQRSLAPRPRDMSLSNAKARNVLGRGLGGVREHLDVLANQERDGHAAELRSVA